MNKKILLIDDSKTQLKTLKILFEREGFEVDTAPDGVEGYKKIFEIAPDIIVSDIMMPNLNGYQLCRLVKDNSKTKKIPIILLTILEQKIDKFWSKKSGADMFVLKSAEIENIIKSIKELIEKCPVSEETKQKIKKQSIATDNIQTELSQILDNSLIRASVMNEFRLLTSYIEDEYLMAKNLFELLSSVLNFDLSLLIINPPNDKDKEVYISSCISLENDFIIKAINSCITKIFGENTSYSFNTVYENWCGIEKLDDNIFQNSYCHEIKFQGKVIGAICFFSAREKEFESQKLFETVLKEVELLIKTQRFYAQNKYLSLTDSLTGLYNRRYLMDMLEREYSRSKRYEKPLSIGMLDIDFFKKVNDTYGHQAGDYLLKEITATIKTRLRKCDIIFRYGGEEILVLLPETDKEKAYIPLERIRQTIENAEFKYKDTIIKTTISIGITDSLQKTDSLEMFIEHADSALYVSKEKGRNRITIYHE